MTTASGYSAYNILLSGPPGSGKTMLARRLPSILPDLSFAEALETTKIYSTMGLIPKDRSLITARPFRAPHHTISDAGLIGGGCHFHKLMRLSGNKRDWNTTIMIKSHHELT